MKKLKHSNFELMRIISMFFIVLYHVIFHGKTLENSSGTILLILQFILCITLVHVNSFVLITGYFQYKKKFSLKSFLKTFFEMYFYKVALALFFISIGMNSFTSVEYFNLFNPFYIPHWYIACYLILYLLSPFLNILIKNMNQHTHRKLILILILCFSFAPFLSNQIVGTNNGLTVIQFIMMYFIGAYLAKYPITENIHFKNYSKNKTQMILLIGSIIFLIINFITLNFGTTLTNSTSSLLQYVGNLIVNSYDKYNFIFVILQSVCYFLWFSSLNIKSKVINYIASCTLGIYLIHEHQCIQPYIYTWFNIANSGPITSKDIIVKVFIVAIIIFIGCALIDTIRQIIFKFIRNRKIYKKISNKFYNYINNY